MNRTIKDATVTRFYDESHDQLGQHFADYNFVRRFKTLTPCNSSARRGSSRPERFTLNPRQQMPGASISFSSTAAFPCSNAAIRSRQIFLTGKDLLRPKRLRHRRKQAGGPPQEIPKSASRP